jgi:hypothetical protein
MSDTGNDENKADFEQNVDEIDLFAAFQHCRELTWDEIERSEKKTHEKLCIFRDMVDNFSMLNQIDVKLFFMLLDEIQMGVIEYSDVWQISRDLVQKAINLFHESDRHYDLLELRMKKKKFVEIEKCANSVECEICHSHFEKLDCDDPKMANNCSSGCFRMSADEIKKHKSLTDQQEQILSDILINDHVIVCGSGYGSIFDGTLFVCRDLSIPLASSICDHCIIKLAKKDMFQLRLD